MTQRDEDTPAYRLGKATHIIQELIGHDPISLQSAEGRKWVRKHAKQEALNFLEDERQRSVAIHAKTAI